MARRRDRTPVNRTDLYGFHAPARGSPKIFWEGVCDVASSTITVREGVVGSEPVPVVMRWSTPEATTEAYDALLDGQRERDFRPADDAFMSLEPVAVNHALVDRIERAFDGVPRGRIGIREAAAIESRLARDDEECVTAQAEDTETDWRDLTDEVLAHDPSVFPFFDDQGFKFVLPAVMRWTIRIAFDRFIDLWGVSYSLACALLKHDNAEALARRWDLSASQVSVVVEWLDAYVGSGPSVSAALQDDGEDNFHRWRAMEIRSGTPHKGND